MKHDLTYILMIIVAFIMLFLADYKVRQLEKEVKELKEEAYRRGYAEFTGEPLEWRWKEQ